MTVAQAEKVETNVSPAMTDDNKLVLTIDPTKNLGLSKSKKTTLVASTHGFIHLAGFMISVNICKK
jgi:hypothetical protein